MHGGWIPTGPHLLNLQVSSTQGFFLPPAHYVDLLRTIYEVYPLRALRSIKIPYRCSYPPSPLFAIFPRPLLIKIHDTIGFLAQRSPPSQPPLQLTIPAFSKDRLTSNDNRRSISPQTSPDSLKPPLSPLENPSFSPL